MIKDALISEDGRFRYSLDRWWGDPDGVGVAWIMLNPSTADAEQDDPTIRRCIRFTQEWGFDGLTVVNLYALRATKPSDLHAWERSISEEEAAHHANQNAAFIVSTAKRAGLVIAAWGVHGGEFGLDIARRMSAGGVTLNHLGLTKEGHPRHPLYLRANVRPERWAVPA